MCKAWYPRPSFHLDIRGHLQSLRNYACEPTVERDDQASQKMTLWWALEIKAYTMQGKAANTLDGHGDS